MPADALSLSDVEARLWAEMARAAGDKLHAWRSPVLATVDDDGLPQARVVVLRDVDAEQRHLLFYTDARSPKCRQIDRRPHGTLVMWARDLGWQLRLGVHLEIVTDGLALSSRWARLKLTPAAQDYLSPLPPGTHLPPAGAPAPERESRDAFAMIDAQVTTIDWLELSPQGHRRAVFSGRDSARWVQP